MELSNSYVPYTHKLRNDLGKFICSSAKYCPYFSLFCKLNYVYIHLIELNFCSWIYRYDYYNRLSIFQRLSINDKLMDDKGLGSTSRRKTILKRSSKETTRHETQRNIEKWYYGGKLIFETHLYAIESKFNFIGVAWSWLKFKWQETMTVCEKGVPRDKSMAWKGVLNRFYHSTINRTHFLFYFGYHVFLDKEKRHKGLYLGLLH